MAKYAKIGGFIGIFALFFEVERKLFTAQKVEAATMEWRYAVLADGLAVRLCGVAFVAVPAVLGVSRGKVSHVIVAEGLGEDACCGYRKILTVALHNGREGQDSLWLEAVAVNYHCLRAHLQSVQGTVHGKDAGI